VNFVGWKGKLWFATHVGHHSIIDGMEKIGIPPESWKPYPGGPISIEGKRVTGKGKTAMGGAKGLEDLHLITYHTRTGTCKDNGAVFPEGGQRPTNVNSITVGKDGTVYTLGRVKRGDKVVGDLIKIPGLFGGR